MPWRVALQNHRPATTTWLRMGQFCSGVAVVAAHCDYFGGRSAPERGTASYESDAKLCSRIVGTFVRETIERAAKAGSMTSLMPATAMARASSQETRP